MTRARRTPKENACQEQLCPVLSKAGPAISAATSPSCKCARSAELEAVLASTLDPVVTIDSFGTIRSASNSVEPVFGWRPEELVGRNVRVLMPEPHHSGHDRYLANYRNTLKTNILGRTRQFEGVRKDGTRFPIELSVSRAEMPDRTPDIFVGILKDVSERRAAEREAERHRRQLESMVRDRTRALEQSHEQLRMAERLSAIGTLAAGLGHDMNNVLLPVRARINALNAIGLPGRAAEHLVQIRKSCAYLQQLSDGLHMLALSPDEDDNADAETDLNEWWSTVGPLLTKAVPKGVRFESTIAQGLPRVPVAPHKLTQAVLNLIVNAGEAIQSMPARPRSALVRLWAHASGAPAAGGAGRERAREIHLGVADNGPGMTPEVRARAFDAFYTTKTRGLGTGLGLSLVRSVVVNAGGQIDVETSQGKGASAKGAGTEIVLSFTAAPERQRRDFSRAAAVHLRDRRAASMSAHILEAAGWHVTRAADPTPPLAPAPGDSTIWVTESNQAALKAARNYAKGTRCAIVAVGKPSPRAAWAKLGAIPVEDAGDFDSLRDAIGQAIAAVTGAPR